MARDQTRPCLYPHKLSICLSIYIYFLYLFIYVYVYMYMYIYTISVCVEHVSAYLGSHSYT